MIENPNVICNDCGFGKQNAQLKEQLESETLAKNKGVEINAELYDENEVLKKTFNTIKMK